MKQPDACAASGMIHFGCQRRLRLCHPFKNFRPSPATLTGTDEFPCRIFFPLSQSPELMFCVDDSFVAISAAAFWAERIAP